jgi:hypothetical protein
LQLLHKPVVASSLHALSQHTPSLQWPDTHWLLAVHAVPIGFKPQELFTQVFGATQSASERQVDLHTAALQTKVPQEALAGVAQAPAPSQVEAGMSWDGEAHSAGLQLSPLAKRAQAPPWQDPVAPQVDCRVAMHSPCGSGVPSATALHKPTDPDRLQALQAPLHALLQHTPWAQNPD